MPAAHATLFRLANSAIRPPAAKRALQLDGPADVAGVALAAGLLDVGSDRVEFARQLLDVLGGEVRVLLDVGDGHGGPPRSLMVQSPDAAEMQVLIRSPSPCSSPDRKSRTWPDSSGSTQVWQMPIRQPNGIWIPTFSPASSSEVAPSISIVLSEIAKVTVPPSPPLSVRAMANRSMCRSSRDARAVPDLLDRVEHRGRARTPRSGRSRQSGTRSSRLGEVELAVRLGQLQVQSVAGLARLQLAQLVVEDHVVRRRRGMDVHDVRARAARLQRAQHRHHRGDAAARADEQELRRRRVG